jgi:hypothetical protein
VASTLQQKAVLLSRLVFPTDFLSYQQSCERGDEFPLWSNFCGVVENSEGWTKENRRSRRMVVDAVRKR